MRQAYYGSEKIMAELDNLLKILLVEDGQDRGHMLQRS
jgi:hypothetical protein